VLQRRADPRFPLRSITPDAERLEKLISELSGKDVNELIAEGSAKLASVPSGGAAAPAAAAGGAAPAAAAEAEKPKEEEKEESDDDMG
jgi:large subunit ribosomal protein LP2